MGTRTTPTLNEWLTQADALGARYGRDPWALADAMVAAGVIAFRWLPRSELERLAPAAATQMARTGRMLAGLTLLDAMPVTVALATEDRGLSSQRGTAAHELGHACLGAA